jgi:hypothetical protein
VAQRSPDAVGHAVGRHVKDAHLVVGGLLGVALLLVTTHHLRAGNAGGVTVEWPATVWQMVRCWAAAAEAVTVSVRPS